MNLHPLFLLLSAVVTRANTAAAAVPTDNPEAACILNSIDWTNSVAARVLNRGFPLFVPDLGVDTSSLPDGRVSRAVLELEPMFEVDVEAFEDFLANGENSQSSYILHPRSGTTTGGNDLRTVMDLGKTLGLTSLYHGLGIAAETAFDHMYGPSDYCDRNSYCRDVNRFATGKGSLQYSITTGLGPLIIKNQYFNLDFLFAHPNGVRLTQAYMAAIDALPEVFESESYLNFGKMFGYGIVDYVGFSSSEYLMGGLNSTYTYMTLGSRHYNGSGCVDPDFNSISYSTSVSDDLQLSDSQKMKLDNYQENIMSLVSLSTKAPTVSPTSTSPSASVPTESPTLNPTIVAPTPTKSVAVALASTSSWFIVVLMLVSFS